MHRLRPDPPPGPLIKKHGWRSGLKILIIHQAGRLIIAPPSSQYQIGPRRWTQISATGVKIIGRVGWQLGVKTRR